MSALVTTRPQPSTPRPYTFPAVIRQEVAGGRIVAADLPGQPLAVASLLLDAGAFREQDGREGTASVLLKALEEGTANRDAAGFAVALESLGASLFTDVRWDVLEIGVEAPADRLLAAVGLLAEAVRTPRLDSDDVVRVRDDEAAALGMQWANPGPKADAALRAALFGAQRPGRPSDGDPDSVARIKVADITGYHQQWLTRPGVLIVAGDLQRLDLAALGAVAFAGTSQPVPAETGLITGVASGARRILLVDRPGAVQSVLRLGHLGPHRAHPDYVTATLVGTVLGGAFTSRLNHLIREVRGYTYGIRGEFATARRFGRFTVSTSVQTGVTAPALVDTVAEIGRTRADGVTEEELAVARTWRAGQLSVEMQTPGAIAGALGTLVVHDLPDNHHAMLRQQLLDATVGDVSQAAGVHLRPDDMVIVVEGDAAVIRADLVATGLGEVIDA